MSCSLCQGEEVVRVRSDPYDRSYPCPECRIVSYHVTQDVTDFALKHSREDADEVIEGIKHGLRDRMLDELIDKVGEFTHEHNLGEGRHTLSARVIVVQPMKKETGPPRPSDDCQCGGVYGTHSYCRPRKGD